MTKEQIEDESKLIQACRMLGATYNRKFITFASGLVVEFVRRKNGDIELPDPDDDAPYVLRAENPARKHYRVLVAYLYSRDFPK